MDPNLPLQMMQFMTGGIVAQSVSVAAELGIADLLHAKRRSSADLAVAAGADAEKLHRLLRFLASLGVFELGADGIWGNTPLADLLRSDVPFSMRAGARMMMRMSSVWPHLLDNVKGGTCAYTLAHGRPIFEDLAGKPEDATIFDSAMNSIHGPETAAVLDAYRYDGVSVLADIGAGAGSVMIETLKRHPAMRGILFDQEHVQARTRPLVEAAGVGDRCRIESGNFFESVPAGADAYTMRHILHDWRDDQCVRILRNVRNVIPATGRLLVIETVVPDGNDPHPSKLFDMIMMACPDGLERTEAKFGAIFTTAGFALSGITPTESPVSVIEARPV